MSLTVLVTGCSSGIGAQIARQLLERPATTVFAAVRQVEDLKPLVDGDAKVGKDSQIVPVQLDVTSDSSIKAAIEAVKTKLAGRPLDALINNAGITSLALDRDIFHKILDVNVVGAALLTEAVLPLLSSKDRRPTIVNVSSNVGSAATTSNKDFIAYKLPTLAYSVSKAALNRQTIYYAAQYEHIRVVSVCPGYNKTKLIGFNEAGQDPSLGAAIVVKALLNVDGPSPAFVGGYGIEPW